MATIENKAIMVPAALVLAASIGAGCRPVNNPDLKPERNLEYVIGQVRGITQNSRQNDVYIFDMREELNKLDTALREHKNMHDSDRLGDVIKFAQAKVFEQKGEYSNAVNAYGAIKTEKRLVDMAKKSIETCRKLAGAEQIEFSPDFRKQLGNFDSKIKDAEKLAKELKGTEYEDNAKKLCLDLDVKRVRYIAGEEVVLGKSAIRSVIAVPEKAIAEEYSRLIEKHKGSHMHDDLKLELAKWYEAKADEYAKLHSGSGFNKTTYTVYTGSARMLYEDVVRRHPETNSYRVAKTAVEALVEKERDVLKNH
ncbi:hypothetical protein KY311_04830 [Candidatus Woesearchaeota archaeon]|nr:hypothetical protein [Candidatus Woesearchaeota archaeon]